MNNQTLLEQIKTVTIDGKAVNLVAVAGMENTWCSRSAIASIYEAKKRQLVQINKELNQVRRLFAAM